ncbi:MAG TPA: energy transducer TonB [Vicinamibacterales bacterium]|jgi:TonB family protein
MKVVVRWLPALAFAIAGMIGLASPASAQEQLKKAKELYDSAAYEDALKVLTPVDMPEAQQYRALCLLALGRTQDAAGAVEKLVSAEPTFAPSAQDVPPRFVTLVSDTKRKLLPSLARRAFNEGRDHFRNGSREEALTRFNLVIALTSDPSFEQSADAEDLRTLANGFIDLAKAAAPPPAPTPAIATKAADKPRSLDPPEIVQPVVVKQYIPPVPTEIGSQGNSVVSVRVLIGANGKVTQASIQQSSHPLYDRLVLQAARDWVYQPATMNGKPVTSEKVVTVQLR